METYTIVIQCWQPPRIVAYVMLDDVLTHVRTFLESDDDGKE